MQSLSMVKICKNNNKRIIFGHMILPNIGTSEPFLYSVEENLLNISISILQNIRHYWLTYRLLHSITEPS